MKKIYILILGILLFSFPAVSQTYVLNEDFDGATGTTPPAGWAIDVISGGSGDSWYFDNPGERDINFPITDPFAIFDSEITSANGQPEEVALVTPTFDASFSNYILLQFDHTFNPASEGVGRIEAFDGDEWLSVISYNSATANPEPEIVDLSTVIGGSTEARLRFIWTGNGSGFWAVDNIQIYASLPLDGGVVSVDSPVSPVTPGLQDVEITLGNYGYNTITTTTVQWTANGVSQPPYVWNGSIEFGQSQAGVVIGSYDFQGSTTLKVWQENPNGQADPNPFNDTIIENLESALCGTYTIGGVDPDFENFRDAAAVLNTAGVSCPVVFLVRDGEYLDQFTLEDINGTSATNTITFRSESGNNTAAVLQIAPSALKFEPLIYLNGSQHISFENIGFATGSLVSYNNFSIMMDGASDITITGCDFNTKRRFDYGLNITGGSQNIEVNGNSFSGVNIRSGSITVSGEGTNEISITGNLISGGTAEDFPTVFMENDASDITFEGNEITGTFRALQVEACNSIYFTDNIVYDVQSGVEIALGSENITVSGNRFYDIKDHPDVPEGTSGILVDNSTDVSIFNNYINTSAEGPVNGICIANSSACHMYFNSINVTGYDFRGLSTGMKILGSLAVISKNNIVSIKQAGIPVLVESNTGQFQFDRNDYYSNDGLIGIYQGEEFFDITSWSAASNIDQNSLSVNPFFTSDTDLSMNQVLLNNSGITIPGIDVDIDGTVRNGLTPDIGAKEYDLCNNDAGINAFLNPQNPLGTGNQEIRVRLQNHGNFTLTSVTINWKVNDDNRPPFSWTGGLETGQWEDVVIGTYNFDNGRLNLIEAWTSGPNNNPDCNPNNDLLRSQELSEPLCGDYTVGGSNPDYTTLGDAARALNLAGVSCPVTISIRDGEYYEQFVIRDFPGSSSENVVIIRSQSGDSTKAIVRTDSSTARYEPIVYLDGAKNLKFVDLGILTGSPISLETYGLTMDGAEEIKISNCFFEVGNERDIGIIIENGTRRLAVRQTRFESTNPRAGTMSIRNEGTQEISVEDNYISGATDWGFTTVELDDMVSNISFTGNTFENCVRALQILRSDNVLISGNLFQDLNDGVFITSYATNTSITGNRFLNILSHPNESDGISAVQAKNVAGLEIVNNFISTAGEGACIGLKLDNVSACKVHYNSLNITNRDPQGKSNGIILRGGSSIEANNNITSVKYAGSPIRIETEGAQLDFDRNNYISRDKTIGYYKDIRYTDLATWADSLNMDATSLSARPFYTSETDLSINQALLNNTGIPLPGISEDIDGTPRNMATPDLGAKEYDPCPNDVGINLVVSPVEPVSGGTEEIIVVLQNQGSSTLTSAKINWDVNDDVQPVFSWTGNLDPGANAEVSIGEFDFSSGSLYTVRVWASDPNSSPDCNNINDTAYSAQLAAPLCGIYTIGGTDGDFGSFEDAAVVLSSAGITCPVTFLVRDSVYEEKLVIGKIPGSSETNTVTFRSESLDSTKAIVKIRPGAISSEPMFFLEGTENVVFENLGFEVGAETGQANYAFSLTGAANIKFTACHFVSVNRFDYSINIEKGSSDISIMHNRFDANDIRASAIQARDSDTRDIGIIGNIMSGQEQWSATMISIRDFVSNVIIEDNQIRNSVSGIYITKADSIIVRHNTVSNSYEAIVVRIGCSDISVSENYLYNIYSTDNAPEGTGGISVVSSENIDIVNNFVHTLGDGLVHGINIEYVDSCRIYFNSVNTTNEDILGRSNSLKMKDSESILVKNNIFNISTRGTPIFIEQVDGFFLDYNNYYDPEGDIGSLDGEKFTNLFEWGQTINGDANSRSINSFFEADTVPLPYQRAINGAGIPIEGILYDIDGIVRNTQAPDIGCVEFVVDIGVLELVNPTLECAHPGEDSVTVYIHLFGHVPFENLKLAWQLDGGQIYYDTIPGPIESSFTHTFEQTVDISAEGEYFFKIWLISTLDDNINNDTLNAWRYSKPLPVITSIEYDNFCTGPQVFFSGEATVESPYFIDYYEWVFGDGETAVGQSVEHTYSEPGYYDVTLQAYSDAGCYGFGTTTIYIDPEFQALNCAYDITPEVCLGDQTGSINLEVSGGYPPYNILLNGDPVSNGLIGNLTTGQYIVSVVDSENCTFADTLQLNSQVLLQPEISADPVEGITPLTVSFDFTANNPYGWTWHFSETDTDTSRQASYTFTKFGDHMVLLEVNSGPPHFCTEYDTVMIFVDIIVEIEANNVFTPNDDGYNDFFEVQTRGIEELTVSIFSRWGDKVYTIEEVDGKWDGKTKSGAKAPDGTYFFDIEALGFNGETYTHKGSVLLLRNASEAYPNPVEENLKVTIHDEIPGPATAHFYSVFGQEVHTEPIPDPQNIIINISHLRSGVYILKITDGKRNYYNRIIKY